MKESYVFLKRQKKKGFDMLSRVRAKILEVLFIFVMSFKMGPFIILKINFVPFQEK